MTRLTWTVILGCLVLAVPAVATAEWPYRTEEASTLGEGRYSLSVGVSRTYQDSSFLPGGHGVLWTFPEVEGTLGVGPYAEVSFHYPLLWFDPSGAGTGDYSSGDLQLWTKLALFPSVVRSLSLRFGVKLPNAPNERGLGTDETDFFASLLLDFRAGPARVSLNGGIGILGSTEVNQDQDDVFTWGTAARMPVWRELSAGFDASGYSGPWGVRTTRRFATLGPVLTWRLGRRLRFDLAGRRGIKDARSWGWAAGITFE